jgi:spore coat polysaccharide biosynthesis protein SpsF
VIATSDQKSDDAVVKFAMQNGIAYFRGSLDNVFDRCLQCCRAYDLTVVARVCADRPFLETASFESFGIDVLRGFDLVTNRSEEGIWPKGLLTEVFSRDALERASKQQMTERQAQHLTEVFYDNPKDFKIQHRYISQERASVNLAVDYPEDLDRIRMVAEAFANKRLELVPLSEIVQLYGEVVLD